MSEPHDFTMPSVFATPPPVLQAPLTLLRGRKFQGPSNMFLLHQKDVAYLVLAKRIPETVFYARYLSEIPRGVNAVVVRTANKGAMKLVGFASVRAALRAIYPKENFMEVGPGVVVNLDFVVALPEPGRKRRIVLIEVAGVLEGIAVSRRGEARLRTALRERQLTN